MNFFTKRPVLKKILLYLVFLFLSLLSVSLLIVYLAAEAVGCAISLGCNEDTSSQYLGVYLVFLVILMLVGVKKLKLKWYLLLLTFISPPVLLIVGGTLLDKYQHYRDKIENRRAHISALEDHRHIQISEPFVRFEDRKGDNSWEDEITVFFHVPLRVTDKVAGNSVRWLVQSSLESKIADESKNSLCAPDIIKPPSFDYYLVDKEYTYGQVIKDLGFYGYTLQPNKQYYLLQQIEFDNKNCQLTDIKNLYDWENYEYTLDTSNVEEWLERNKK